MNGAPPAAGEYRLFHLWLVLTSLVVFAGYLAFTSGVYGLVVRTDPSRLSIAISILFVLGSCHCGLLSLRLGREDLALRDLVSRMSQNMAATTDFLVRSNNASSATLDYFRALVARLSVPGAAQAGEYTQLTDVLAEHVRGQHESGWYVTNMLVKLGLLGTVIGFILMLSSVMAIESFDIADAQGLLGRMTIGMGVALYTTMLGLVCSMLLGMQYLLMDRGSDRLVAEAVFIAESELIPFLHNRQPAVATVDGE